MGWPHHEKYPELVVKVHHSLYVDDLLTGGQTIQQAKTKKDRAINFFNDATFRPHKWKLNVEELEEKMPMVEDGSKQLFAKQQLGVKPNESGMLGLKWDKVQDTPAMSFPHHNDTVTKHWILRNLA